MTANCLETALEDQTSSIVRDRERLRQELHFLQHCARVSHANAQMHLGNAKEMEQAAGLNSVAAVGLSRKLQTAQTELASVRARFHASRTSERHGAEMLAQFKVQLGKDVKSLCQQLANADGAASAIESRNTARMKDCAAAREEAASEASFACSMAAQADKAEKARDTVFAEAAARETLTKVGAFHAMRRLEEDFIQERSVLRARQKLRQTRLQELEVLVSSNHRIRRQACDP